ncbi:type II toxin-antitoxin system Phd/YefM family antitoxin [Rhizobium sp. NPDC090275]|jgi:prevent-host-death family protein|uniref:type II toxin-antitoxin system Phd/YefM family antitoxin n=1 Tax=unclassified Rhizobium TaxID=2613769 RepID=UPI000DB9DB6E
MTIISSREFNQNRSSAFRATAKGAVIITDRGKPAYVLLTVDEYRKLTKQEDSISEAFYVPGADEIEFEIPKLDDTGIKPVDFS